MKMTIDAVLKNLPAVTVFIQEQLTALGMKPKGLMQMDIVTDELFSNICHYAYPDTTGSAEIQVEAENGKSAVKVVFTDSGIAFNPLLMKEPDITLPLEERSDGGLGIFMVRKLTDRITYERIGGKNVLSVWKHL